MVWYDPTTWFKANPAQEYIGRQEGSVITTDADITYAQAFDKLETVNRGVSLIVNGCASLDFDIKDKIIPGVVAGIRQKQLQTLLNTTPNPYQSVNEFRRAIFTDYLLEGNIFIYYDGVHLYHLPAAHVFIHTDPKTFVAKYTYNGITDMGPNEVIHIRDLNSSSIYRGSSRLVAADRNVKILYKMQSFQEQFFDNGAVAGLILTSDNTLSQSAKEKTLDYWAKRYSPKNGARRPMILDAGLKPAVGIATTFQEMDYDTSIKTHDVKILKALGVPPILLDGGNNANISPNLRLFYLETVLPIVNSFTSAMERFFGYDLEPIVSNLSALQPDMKDTAAYYTTLVNGGVMTPNEAREGLRLTRDTDSESDKLRVPANIAGSAANPSEGGKPPKPKDSNNTT